VEVAFSDFENFDDPMALFASMPLRDVNNVIGPDDNDVVERTIFLPHTDSPPK